MSGQSIYKNSIICNGNFTSNTINVNKIYGFFANNTTTYASGSPLQWNTTPTLSYSNGITLTNNNEFTFDTTGIFVFQYTLNIDTPTGGYYVLQIQLQSSNISTTSWTTINTNYTHQYFTNQAEVSNFFQINHSSSKKYRIIVVYSGFSTNLTIATNLQYTNLSVFKVE